MAADHPLRILFAPETFNLGETSRAVEVAKHLTRWGHDVLFMGYSRRFADYVRRAGFTLEFLDPELSERQADQLIAADQGRSLRHPFSTDMVRRRVASERALIEHWQPDCVVIGTTLTLFISARAAAIPLVYVRPYAMSKGHLAQMRTFPLCQGNSRLGERVNRIAGRVVRTVVPRVRWKPASFSRVAAEHRVSLPPRTLDALDADLTLIASLFPHLDQRPLAPGEVAVGPVYAHGAGELPERVRALADSDRPVVYVGLGSSARGQLAVDILHQVGTLDVEVVSSAGRYLSEAERHRLPGNVQVHDFLPAHLLAGIIDASVIHGGEGTVQTACASGVPFAGIGLQSEQRFNIDECVRYGNAVRFTPGDIRSGRLPELLTGLLRDDDARQAAQQLHRAAHPVGGSNAASAILTFIRGDVGAPPGG
ncbi:glycosyltransferase [Ruania zhangjianzhongii]|uniref:glycosyltransferase n=1 Tax=Ruania zhangjianzhongii TaxID=2603206 RepID=UPI0011C97956|nr:glycosyltransferase family 1 protein [Ruania zhangjianzhongii]